MPEVLVIVLAQLTPFPGGRWQDQVVFLGVQVAPIPPCPPPLPEEAQGPASTQPTATGAPHPGCELGGGQTRQRGPGRKALGGRPRDGRRVRCVQRRSWLQ